MSLWTALIYLILGSAVLIAGGEILVRGAVRFATMLKIPALIVGLTIVAICTSAPEMAVSLVGILGKSANPDIAVGNVVGSNIFNILFILGITALFRPIGISSAMIRREIPFLIAVSILVWIAGAISFRATDGGQVHILPQWGGFLFILIFLVYLGWTIRSARHPENKEIATDIAEQVVAPTTGQNVFSGILLSIVLIAAGLGLLVGGSNMFVDGAVGLAKLFGVSELVISLTILAAGTSLPELTVSIIAAIRGKQDIAIGNIVGSNTFNILGILGVSSALVPEGLLLSKQVMAFDIPMMIGVALLGSVLCITGKKLSRMEGLVLLIAYLCYVFYLFRG